MMPNMDEVRAEGEELRLARKKKFDELIGQLTTPTAIAHDAADGLGEDGDGGQHPWDRCVHKGVFTRLS